MTRLEIENYRGEIRDLREKCWVYEQLFHQLQLHSAVTLNQAKCTEIIEAINSWSYAHREGNGELDNKKLVRMAFGRMKKLVGID